MYFGRKIGQKYLSFYAQTTASFLQKYDHNFGF
jgi:hypothetical protein